MSTGARGAGQRILIVDDDAPLVRGLTVALESQGYEVRSLDRGMKALDTALVFMPHLVLLDVMMPGMDGWEVLTRLREHPETKAVPVIMLTAMDTDAAKIKGFALGTDDYVTKPFNLSVLRCRVSAVLRRTTYREQVDPDCLIPVVAGSGLELTPCHDVYYIEGIRNYTYIHTFDGRSLGRLHLGAVEEKQVPSFMRVHRSYIVNMDHVKGCGWVSKSAYRLRMADREGTEIPVSRSLVGDVQRRLGLKS